MAHKILHFQLKVIADYASIKNNPQGNVPCLCTNHFHTLKLWKLDSVLEKRGLASSTYFDDLLLGMSMQASEKLCVRKKVTSRIWFQWNKYLQYQALLVLIPSCLLKKITIFLNTLAENILLRRYLEFWSQGINCPLEPLKFKNCWA